MTVVTLHDASATQLEHYTTSYLSFKKKRLTAKSEYGYRSILKEFAAYYPTKQIEDFEPPTGSILIEDWLTARWGECAPRTYNKGHSVLSDFFQWHVARGTLARDPMLTLERATPRQVHRTTFTDAERQRILATNPYPREQVALRLLLDYGLRKGALLNVQFRHFDADKRRLTIFTKGEKVFTLPIVDDYIWLCLELLEDKEPDHYLVPRQTRRRRKPPHQKQLTKARSLLSELTATLAEIDDEACARELSQLAGVLGITDNWLELTITAASAQTRLFPAERGGDHAAHIWWYRCLARAGIVEPGTTSGKRLHMARHTAGQRVLDKTGNLKAAQTLLCHATIATTGDIYLGWELEQLASTMRDVVPVDDLPRSLHDRVRGEGVRV